MKTFVHALLTLTLVGCAAELDVETDVDAVADEDEATASDAITGPYMAVSYARGLVRIDFADGGRCSGFLVGPNLVMTAAHCVAEHSHTGTHEGTTNGVRWGYVDARLVFKPSASETMCLHSPCFTEGGNVEHATFVGWWHAGWDEDDPDDDIALLTRGTGATFTTRPMHPDDAAPRALAANDYLRIFAASSTEENHMFIAGYGANSDTTIGTNPRVGGTSPDAWSTQLVRSTVGYSGVFTDSICSGDSGGPLYISHPLENRDYVVGITSGSSGHDGFCPEAGDKLYFSRIAPDIGMVNAVQDWAGKPDCEDYDTDSLDGDGKYYRCW